MSATDIIDDVAMQLEASQSAIDRLAEETVRLRSSAEREECFRRSKFREIERALDTARQFLACSEKFPESPEHLTSAMKALVCSIGLLVEVNRGCE